ncbi:isoquinoline 1-oxidoreductase subunit alpha [Ketogulonicigenium robustum]|uniref:Isoquinoline 1-oxidoreductase subunit alpha n=1 Tax=Ketogulonicigenium robustum TaxID=92947 RepID=A0A1W6NWP3_9RHOB|nr:(2Fe-2S)-binding protein [Ketogulonicigenium robustum]ARO13447.1 isoquinoline 1-oxidoreductase subunit alpha [Ketogulonicigenium robustum]
MFELSINGQNVSVDVDDDTPLLWVIREELGMTGTKFGCGIGMCGACTVHIDGVARRSCVTTVAQAAGVKITTIEGLSEDDSHPVQEAWRSLRVPQCGYCQSGQIMQAASLLAGNPNPTDQEIDQAMTGNLCRCMTYVRIRQAVREAVTAINEGAVQNG